MPRVTEVSDQLSVEDVLQPRQPRRTSLSTHLPSLDIPLERELQSYMQHLLQVYHFFDLRPQDINSLRVSGSCVKFEGLPTLEEMRCMTDEELMYYKKSWIIGRYRSDISAEGQFLIRVLKAYLMPANWGKEACMPVAFQLFREWLTKETQSRFLPFSPNHTFMVSLADNLFAALEDVLEYHQSMMSLLRSAVFEKTDGSRLSQQCAASLADESIWLVRTNLLWLSGVDDDKVEFNGKWPEYAHDLAKVSPEVTQKAQEVCELLDAHPGLLKPCQRALADLLASLGIIKPSLKYPPGMVAIVNRLMKTVPGWNDEDAELIRKRARGLEDQSEGLFY